MKVFGQNCVLFVGETHFVGEKGRGHKTQISNNAYLFNPSNKCALNFSSFFVSQSFISHVAETQCKSLSH